MKKVRVINKNQLFKIISIGVVVIILIILLINNKVYSNSETKYKFEYITKGETLWQIAQNEIEKNEYFKNKDIRNVMYEIKKVNNMTTSNLFEGMELKIPVY